MAGLGQLALLMCVLAAAALAAKDTCGTCKQLVQRFHDGEDKTAKSIHFSGGNPDGWTLDKEKFLGKYAMGEARLVEILESVCGTGDRTCQDFLADQEEAIEEWWGGEDRPDLETHLCYGAAKACCPSGTFGPACKKCPGKDSVCSGHGTCSGDGQRTGSGKCKCNAGYRGKACDKCVAGYYGDGAACLPCDPTCDNCTAAGPAACVACKPGHVNESGVCQDVDECTNQPCRPEQYCSNIPGSYVCNSCHPGCLSGCFGPGAKSCYECVPGYTRLPDGGCQDIDECAVGDHRCPTGQYCSNNEGHYDCLTCDSMCGPLGCRAAGAAGCIDCAAGHELDPATTSCRDIDECRAFPCPDAMDCNNTAGSHSCYCQAPNRMEGDVCVPPVATANLEALAQTQAELDADEGALNEADNKFRDSVLVGPSATRAKAVRVSFPEGRFSSAPRVVLLQAVDPCCGDAFNFWARNVDATGFALVTQRADSQSGWGQDLRVSWAAYAVPAKDEL